MAASTTQPHVDVSSIHESREATGSQFFGRCGSYTSPMSSIPTWHGTSAIAASVRQLTGKRALRGLLKCKLREFLIHVPATTCLLGGMNKNLRRL